jgi:hypothetical protein
MQPNALQPLPYTLVDIDEPPKKGLARLREADALQWKLWFQQYAWFLSLLTAAPGIALIVFTLTGNAAFSVGITALATITPGAVFWWRTRRLT